MFEFSSKTQVNKKFKLFDILKQIKADKEIKTDAMKINSIMLSNVINAASLNTKVDDVFKEIYIFVIDLNKNEIPKLFLEALDKNIRLHTYFIFTYNDKIYTTMCYKEIGKTVKLTKYYNHEFSKKIEKELPIVNSVADVYKILYSYEVDIPYRDEESPSDFVKRINLIHKLQFQISKTEKAIQFEAQPKKKYEYHTRLLQYKKKIEELSKMED